MLQKLANFALFEKTQHKNWALPNYINIICCIELGAHIAIEEQFATQSPRHSLKWKTLFNTVENFHRGNL